MRASRLFSLMIFCVGFGVPASGQEFIPARDAMRQFVRLNNQDVRVVLRDMDGQEKVAHGRVSRIPITEDSVRLEPQYFTRPGTGENLIQEYLEQELGRKLTTAALDQQLITDARIPRVILEPRDNVMLLGDDPHVVLSIEEIDLTGPEVPVKAFFKPVKLSKEVDPFQTELLDEPSCWVIEYGIADDPKRFRFRLRNTVIVNRFQRDEWIVPIEQITIDPPKWHFLNQQWIRAVPFTVQYPPTEKYGADHRVTRYFEVDGDGYLVKLHAAWDDVLEPAYLQRLRLWKEAERERARSTGGR